MYVVSLLSCDLLTRVLDSDINHNSFFLRSNFWYTRSPYDWIIAFLLNLITTTLTTEWYQYFNMVCSIHQLKLSVYFVYLRDACLFDVLWLRFKKQVVSTDFQYRVQFLTSICMKNCAIQLVKSHLIEF